MLFAVVAVCLSEAFMVKQIWFPHRLLFCYWPLVCLMFLATPIMHLVMCGS